MSHQHLNNDPDDEGSVTRIIRKMQKGDSEGASLIWERFYPRLMQLVKIRLRQQRRVLADEEDVALQSFTELFRGLKRGQYPALENRDSLWRLLVTVAGRNVIDEVNRESRLKRGGGKVMLESSLSTDDSENFLDNLASSEASPEVHAMVTERCADLLESLEDPELQAIAVMKMSGLNNQEIANSLGKGNRTIERRLADIRSLWGSSGHV